MPQTVHFKLLLWDALCSSRDSVEFSEMPQIEQRSIKSATPSVSFIFDASVALSSAESFSTSCTSRECNRRSNWFENVSWQTPHFFATWNFIRCRFKEKIKIDTWQSYQTTNWNEFLDELKLPWAHFVCWIRLGSPYIEIGFVGTFSSMIHPQSHARYHRYPSIPHTLCRFHKTFRGYIKNMHILTKTLSFSCAKLKSLLYLPFNFIVEIGTFFRTGIHQLFF